MTLTIFILPSSVYAASLKINKTNLNLWKGETYKLTNTDGKATWNSNNKSVVTISSNGFVRAKKAGTAIITCKNKMGTKTCKVVVKNQPVINGNSTEWIYAGRTKRFYVSNTFSNVRWNSSNTSNLSVTTSGITKAIGPVDKYKTATAILSATVKSDASTKTLKRTIKIKWYPEISCKEVSVKDKETVTIYVKNTTEIPAWSVNNSNVSLKQSGPNAVIKGEIVGKSAIVTAKFKKMTLKSIIHVVPHVSKTYININSDAERLAFDTLYEEQMTQPTVKDKLDVSGKYIMNGETGFPYGRDFGGNHYAKWSGAIYRGGYGCAGFALLMNENIYQKVAASYPSAMNKFAKRVKKEEYSSYKNRIKVGDIIHFDYEHFSVVMQVLNDRIIFVDGNVSGKIVWGLSKTFESIDATFDYALTRWP